MNDSSNHTTLRQDILAFARHHLRGWRGALALAAAVAVPALWLGGPWLVAAGALSLLISLAPCLVMCALGICVMKNCNKKSDSEGAADVLPTTTASSGAGAGNAADSATVEFPAASAKVPRE